MSDITNLTCPSVSHSLLTTPDLDRFACGHCGNEHIVKRGGGIVSLTPVVEGLKEVRSGVDKTASELAIERLQKEIYSLTYQRATQRGSWLGTSISLIIFVPLGLFFLTFMFGIVIGDYIWGIGMLIISIVITFFVFRWVIIRDKEKKKKLAPLDESIRKKEAELQYHQRIVSGR